MFSLHHPGKDIPCRIHIYALITETLYLWQFGLKVLMYSPCIPFSSLLSHCSLEHMPSPVNQFPVYRQRNWRPEVKELVPHTEFLLELQVAAGPSTGPRWFPSLVSTAENNLTPSHYRLEKCGRQSSVAHMRPRLSLRWKRTSPLNWGSSQGQQGHQEPLGYGGK